MSAKQNVSTMKRGETDETRGATRRDFIERTLKMTAGAYVGMSIVDKFLGPKMTEGGMPLYAASGRAGDIRPADGGGDGEPGGIFGDHERPLGRHERMRLRESLRRRDRRDRGRREGRGH